ncbi:MAG: ketosteroid isomerase-related protein, partial [Gammaproteobacteria bacterium]
MNQDSITLVQQYYAAFNAGDMDTFLGLLTDDVVHDINQGERQIGKDSFKQFMACMNNNYKEQLVDMVVMATEDGTRAAAEFVVLGEYLKTDEGLPEAQGQTYRLPAGAFF